MTEKKKFGIPVWVGWIINAIAWGLFVATMDHTVEIIMGVACLFAAFIGFKHRKWGLIFSSLVDAIWMFGWGFGMMDNLIRF
jgi:hypothetical protein